MGLTSLRITVKEFAVSVFSTILVLKQLSTYRMFRILFIVIGII
jgi:hypothetical protein